jgi:hypothetical protein
MSATTKRRAPGGLAGEALLIWTLLGHVVGSLGLLTAAASRSPRTRSPADPTSGPLPDIAS